VSHLWAIVRRHAVDAVIVLAALESGLAVAFAGDDPSAPTTTRWLGVPVAAAVLLPLLARRRFPFAAPAFLWLLAGSISFVDGRLLVYNVAPYAGGLAATLWLGQLESVQRARVGLVIALGCVSLIVHNNPEHATDELLFVPVLVAIAWVAGLTLRERSKQAVLAEDRARQAELARGAAARIAVAEERARIARELHDVVAHAMSVMVLQVGAVRHRLPGELEEDGDALRNVEQAGRTALAEMRRLLGALRRDEDAPELAPRPSLDGLDPLLEHIRRTGLPVELHVEGEPHPLPAAIDLSAYRIVQEGLTNAMKHAGASQADVVLRYEPDAVELEVRDDGEGRVGSDGGGYGLLGIRERVKILGGEMTAAPAPGRGFVLKARLPLGRNGR
jgi:signal transduction histidine kinase